MGIKATRGKLIIETEKKETKVMGFMVNPEGRDNNINGYVISVGNDIRDIEPGDLVILPGNQGHEVTIGDDYVCKIVAYGAVHLYQPEERNIFGRIRRYLKRK